MRRIELAPSPGFHLLETTLRSQAATMVIGPGESVGGPRNEHEKSDQWLYVLAGSGTAIVEGEPQHLRPGTLVLIEAGEHHEIVNDGAGTLETLNIYAPAEY